MRGCAVNGPGRTGEGVEGRACHRDEDFHRGRFFVVSHCHQRRRRRRCIGGPVLAVVQLAAAERRSLLLVPPQFFVFFPNSSLGLLFGHCVFVVVFA